MCYVMNKLPGIFAIPIFDMSCCPSVGISTINFQCILDEVDYGHRYSSRTCRTHRQTETLFFKVIEY